MLGLSNTEAIIAQHFLLFYPDIDLLGAKDCLILTFLIKSVHMLLVCANIPYR